jgi:hypothetical protein
MIYSKISKEMSSSYFGLDEDWLFAAGDTQPLPSIAVFSLHVHCALNTAPNSGTLDSNCQNSSSPKYNDDISLLI